LLSTEALLNTTNTTLHQTQGGPDPRARRSDVRERKRGYGRT